MKLNNNITPKIHNYDDKKVCAVNATDVYFIECVYFAKEVELMKMEKKFGDIDHMLILNFKFQKPPKFTTSLGSANFMMPNITMAERTLTCWQIFHAIIRHILESLLIVENGEMQHTWGHT